MKLNIKEIKNEDLEKKLDELRTDLMKAQTKVSAGGPLPKGQGNIRNIKKNIARIKTKMMEVGKK